MKMTITEGSSSAPRPYEDSSPVKESKKNSPFQRPVSHFRMKSRDSSQLNYGEKLAKTLETSGKIEHLENTTDLEPEAAKSKKNFYTFQTRDDVPQVANPILVASERDFGQNLAHLQSLEHLDLSACEHITDKSDNEVQQVANSILVPSEGDFGRHLAHLQHLEHLDLSASEHITSLENLQ